MHGADDSRLVITNQQIVHMKPCDYPPIPVATVNACAGMRVRSARGRPLQTDCDCDERCGHALPTFPLAQALINSHPRSGGLRDHEQTTRVHDDCDCDHDQLSSPSPISPSLRSPALAGRRTGRVVRGRRFLDEKWRSDTIDLRK